MGNGVVLGANSVVQSGRLSYHGVYIGDLVRVARVHV
jgi:hypothetical protein